MAFMADIGLRCTRRKQANPRRKGVELENTMPEETDLMAEAAENSESTESRNKSKDFVDLSANSEELKINANEINTSIKAKKISTKTKKDIKQNNMISSSEISAKNVICNTTQRNGFTKTSTSDYIRQNQDNESNCLAKVPLNGHDDRADDTDIEDDLDGSEGPKDPKGPEGRHESKEKINDFGKTNEKSKKSNESSVKGLEQQTEDKKIEEYLQRSDTAVIFPEPVEKVKTNTQLNKNCRNGKNEKTGQSVRDSIEEKEKIVPKVNENRLPRNGSSNQSETTAPLNVLHARCPHCGRIFRGQRSSVSLEEHITSIHAVSTPTSKANTASSPSSTHSSSAAMGRSDTEHTLVCSKCKASFAHRDQLDKHELLHSAPAQNTTRIDNKAMSDESQVLRKFKCPECFKAFKFKHHLKEHIRIHSGEKPFACPNCAKRFSHSGSYSSHMTSKKCLVVNLKVRKVDQIRSQRNRNNHLSVNGATNGLSSQTSLNKLDLLVNSSNCPTNLKISSNNNRIFKNEETFDITSNPNLSVFKNEPNDNFAPIFLTSDLRRCVPEGVPFANYVPTNYPSGMPGLHPALFSAAAASVGLPTHYLSSALSNYPEVANAILRSQMDRSAKEVEMSRDKCSINCNNNNKLDLVKISDNKSVFENYDLNSMKKILQIVDSSATSKSIDSVNALNSSGFGDIQSLNPSPLTLSASSLLLPQIAPIDSPEDIKKSFSNSLICFSCRYCSEYFENKTDLYQHESQLCKSRIYSPNRSSNEFNKDNNSNDLCNRSHHNSNALNSSAAESDEESQRDSSSLEEEVMTTDGKKVRVRSVLGEDTLRILRAQYEINPRPKKHDILRLADEVNYPPRVVQVWFQNMRARDRRLGKPIAAHHGSTDLSSHNHGVNTFSPPHHSPQHSIANPLMPISIPHYKPASNPSLATNNPYSAAIASFPDINGLNHFGQRINNNNNNNRIYYLNSSEFSLTPSLKPNSNKLFSSQSDSLSLSDEPLDLSLRSKPYVEDLTNSNNNNRDSEEKYKGIEVLNLSQKSSRSQTENSSEELPNNISLALIQQQQRKELEQTSIVRSMLMNKCRSDVDSPGVKLELLNAMNGTAMQSPERMARCSPTTAEEAKDIRRQLPKRPLSDSEDVGHLSDSNNPSDDYSSTTSPNRTKPSIASPTKLWKATNDNHVMSCDDQSPPPDANSQADGTGLFTCDQCDKTFSKQSSLARHKYEHSGQRPHKCDVCSKAFKHKHHLTEHKRLHSGEKPFQCKKCLKRFSHSGSYSQHMNHRYSYCKPYRE